MGLNWEVNIRHTKTLSLLITVNASPNSSTCTFRAVTYFTDVPTVHLQVKHSNHSLVCLFPLLLFALYSIFSPGTNSLSWSGVGDSSAPRGWAGWPSEVAPKQHFHGSAVLFFFHRWSELLSTSTCVFRPEERPKACLIFPTTPVGIGSKFTLAYKPCPEGFVSTHGQSSAWESVYLSFQRKAEAWGSQTTKFIIKSCIDSRGEGLLLNWAKLKYFDSLW